jgi:hypothetical protein
LLSIAALKLFLVSSNVAMSVPEPQVDISAIWAKRHILNIISPASSPSQRNATAHFHCANRRYWFTGKATTSPFHAHVCAASANPRWARRWP